VEDLYRDSRKGPQVSYELIKSMPC
jgi:hypothetical protein